jgi:hypothetical protein
MLPVDRHVIRCSVISLIAITAFVAAGFLLETVTASDEAALVEDIATHVRLNRIELQRLQGELDQLQYQLSAVTTSLRINHDYLRIKYTQGNGKMGRTYALPKRMTLKEVALSERLESV